MNIDERVRKVAEASGLSQAEVKKIIEKKKEEAAGLLTDHGAIYALEKEYGLGTEEGSAVEYTKIAQLKKDSNNVNVLGVVREIRPIKKFQTQKRSGQFARLVITDGSGETTVVLWDKTADIVATDKIKIGTVIAIRNAYTKESLDKKPEVHVGNLSRMFIDPKNIDSKIMKELPKVSEGGLRKIGDLKEGDNATMHAKVLFLYPKSEFARSDGSKGYRSSMIVGDETGKVRIVMWDANADSVENFAEGDVLRAENGQVRTGNRGLELHIGSRGRVLKSDARINLPEAAQTAPVKEYRIAELEPNTQSVVVSGRVTRILPIKEFTSGDRSGKLASLIIIDDTGSTRAVLWGDKTEYLKSINTGDIVTIKNAYTKQSMNGETEVHVSRGTIDVNPAGVAIADMNALINKHATDKKVSELEPDDRNVRITGKIEDADENAMVFEICSECGARIENVAGEWICDVCGETEPAYGMVLSCGVSDGSGDIRAVFYRDLAEQMSGLSVPDALNLIGQSGDELAPVRQIREDIAGKNVVLTGNVRYNDYQDKLELMVSSVVISSSTSAPKKSASKKKEAEEVPKEILEEEDIEIEEIKLED